MTVLSMDVVDNVRQGNAQTKARFRGIPDLSKPVYDKKINRKELWFQLKTNSLFSSRFR